MKIRGTISRLVPPEHGHPERVFFRPDADVDLSNIDGTYRLASGEIAVPAPLEGRIVGENVRAELVEGAWRLVE